jgi:hypothetical protein
VSALLAGDVQFTTPPKAEKVGDKVKITFSVSAPTDVEVAILNAKGDVKLANVEGLVRIHASGGSAEIRDIKGNVDVDGRGRDVDATGITGALTVTGDFTGSMQFKNVTQTLRYSSSRTDLTVQKLQAASPGVLGKGDSAQ